MHSGLTLAFEREGLSSEVAAEAARSLGNDDERAAQLYSRNVLGINPSELGSPWIAAGASLATFAIGAIVPLVPWYFFASTTATYVSIAASLVAAFVIGAFLGHNNGRILRGGVRQTIVIVLAAGVTYGAGSLFAVKVQ